MTGADGINTLPPPSCGHLPRPVHIAIFGSYWSGPERLPGSSVTRCPLIGLPDRIISPD